MRKVGRQAESGTKSSVMAITLRNFLTGPYIQPLFSPYNVTAFYIQAPTSRLLAPDYSVMFLSTRSRYLMSQALQSYKVEL